MRSLIPFCFMISGILFFSGILFTNFAGRLWGDELPPSSDKEVDFEREIRPILEQHCIACHGRKKQESGLRLDRRDLAMVGGDSGKAILVGESGKSRLIHYVSGIDPDHKMPPDGEGLSKESIGLLRAWIDRGANWPEGGPEKEEKNDHWAYRPLSSPKPPKIVHGDWVKNEIDPFILSKIEEQGLVPSQEADRATLIRRLSLDLTGLLPNLEEVDHFLHDPRPNAYEVLVDRLLDSPHFGERWGRHWLDMARYADSDGYEKDNPRPDAYRWRDWVIQAFNDDMPFDQFTIEQIAGDLLPHATDMQRLATAFHRQTLTNTEGGTDQEQFRFEACFDRTETTGSVWLGLTIGCARCHSHKYDAISQREYYQLFAFFNNGDEQTHVVPKSREEVEAYAAAKRAHEIALVEATASLRSAQENVGPEQEAWEVEASKVLASMAANPFKRVGIENPKVTSDGEVTLKVQKDGSILASGKNPARATYTLVGRTDGTPYDRIRLDVLSDKSLPAKGPGRVAHGNFVLSEITAEISESEDFAISTPLVFHSARADHEQPGRPFLAKDAIDLNQETGWAIAPQFGKDHWAEFELKEPLPADKKLYLRVRLSQQHGQEHTIGKFKISLQLGTEPSVTIPENIVKILKTAKTERSETQKQELLDHYSAIDPRTKKLVDRLESIKKKEPAKPELSVRVIAQRAKDPRKTFVLRRGEFLEPLLDAEVQPSGLSVLPPLATRNEHGLGDRLDLARWLVSSENPVTPRVTVNHVWRTLFGAGIVRTANDFGVRGELPTHPELLDWLANEFLGQHAEGKAWSRKSLIKKIVMSATYRQSSIQRSDLVDRDPQNMLLARQNRLRVEGEIIRDISLDVAGLLSRKIGGPSVFPALPPGIAELSYAGNFKWNVSDGADRYRRGMYTFFKRTSPHPNLITFDCPDANLTCVDRNTSNTPLQALVALNNESFSEAARAFAKRVLLESGRKEEKDKIGFAFRLCLARHPKEHEVRELESLLGTATEWYGDHPSEAKKLIGHDVVSDVAMERNAAWIALTRILTNLDEFITRE